MGKQRGGRWLLDCALRWARLLGVAGAALIAAAACGAPIGSSTGGDQASAATQTPAAAPSASQGSQHATGDANAPAGGNTTAVGAANANAGAAAANETASADANTVVVVDTNTIFGAAREAGPQVTDGNGLLAASLMGCTPADYIAAIQIGGQPVHVIVDSGSSTLAVASTTCSSCQTPNDYNAVSGTALGVTLNANYGVSDNTYTGWQGEGYSDVVTLLGPDANVGLAQQMNVAAITAQNRFFSVNSCAGAGPPRQMYDGILGVGPDALLGRKMSSVVGAFFAGGQFAYNAFAVQICGEGGNVFFGGYPAAAVDQLPAFAPMQTGPLGAYYTVRWADFSLGGTSLATDVDAVVDNGTSALFFPEALYNQVIDRLVADGNFAANFNASMIKGQTECASSRLHLSREALDAALPRLAFSFVQDGGQTATVSLPATYSYLYPMQARNGVLLYCPAIYYADQPFVLFGNVAMRRHLVVFDRANLRVGFAEQSSCGDDVIPYAH